MGVFVCKSYNKSMNDRKIVFLDCDNTLLTLSDEGYEYIPESAVKAIDKARENGVLVYLCTGRSVPELVSVMKMIELDGIIGASGAFIIEEGKMVYHRVMEEDDVTALGEYLKGHNVAYSFESNKGIYSNKLMIDYYLEDPSTAYFAKIMEDIEKADTADVNKVIYLSYDLSIEEVARDFKDKYDITAYSYGINNYGGEISAKGINKGSAVKKVLERKGIDVSCSYSIGDGYNDIEMFKNTAYAAVMGNGAEELDRYTDYRSSDIDDDGILNAFRHYELI